MLHIVSATPHDPQTFWGYTLLGRSLLNLVSAGNVVAEVAFQSTKPLPAVYNEALAGFPENDTVLFVHDDAGLDDFYLLQRLDDALANYGVVGVAGNTRRFPDQKAWHLDEKGAMDRPSLSGAVMHLDRGVARLTHFGPAPRRVKLLDGVFLAARVGSLRAARVAFDAQFDFHFYDLDFCRTCETNGLTMGTWPIAITHGGVAAYGSPSWNANLTKYLAKWGS